jgi:hypothetical protein
MMAWRAMRRKDLALLAVELLVRKVFRQIYQEKTEFSLDCSTLQERRTMPKTFRLLSQMAILSAVAWRGPVFAQFNPPVSAENIPEDIANFDALKSLVTERGIKSLDQLLDVIPTKMKSKVVFVYDSHAFNANLATPTTPRMLFWNADGSLIFSIHRSQSAENTAAGKDFLEAIDFDKTTKEYSMFITPFDGVTDPTTVVKRNDGQCLVCHGTNPRPILHDYNTWPGFYGSFAQYGLSLKGTKEFDYLTSFLGKINDGSADPRYLKVNTLGFKLEADGYSYNLPDNPAVPTIMMGFQIEKYMWERLTAKIMRSDKYQELKPLLYYLGVPSEVCAPEHRRLTDTYSAWLKGAEIGKGKAVLEKIRRTVEKQFAQKRKAFDEFNTISIQRDQRGLLSGPAMELVVQHDPFYQLDYLMSEKKFVMLESLMQTLKLDTDDISTARDWSVGIHHAAGGGIGRPSVFGNYFAYIGFLLTKMDPTLPASLQDCEAGKAQAMEAIQHLSKPNPSRPGILYTNTPNGGTP